MVSIYTAWRALLAPLLLILALIPSASAALPIDKLRLPPGFSIQLVSDRLPGARSMALGEDGTVYVGSMRAGRVYALRLKDGRAESVHTVASDLNFPNGVAVRGGALYVAEVGRILRFDGIAGRLANPPQPVLVTDALPKDYHHGWKFIAFGPDGRLYVPVGAPCNVCEPDSRRYANILRMNADGSGIEPYALGVRNSVGFDWHPQTGELWFSDNGRDWLGDDLPSCELNRVQRAGQHFGFPYCHQGDTPDPEFGSKRRCAEFVPPALNVGAHTAPLGLRFYTGGMFPADYRNDILLALHGSWNRSEKTGYRVIRVRFEGGKVAGFEPFVEGWLQRGENWGRPVDVLQLADGSVLISDDQNGAIYRVTYQRR